LSKNCFIAISLWLRFSYMDTQVCPYTDLRAVLELEDPGAAADAENAEGSQRE
jgi:hypothetical protein